MKNPTLIVASLAIAIFGVSCSSSMADSGRRYSHNPAGIHKRGSVIAPVKHRLDGAPPAKPIVRKIYMPGKNRVTANPGKVVLAGS